MASILDTHGSLRLSSTDLDSRPLYLSSRAATVIARIADHIAHDHECRAIDADLSARANITAYRVDATDIDSARDGLEAALDCAEAIRAERACFQRIIETARVALAALDDAERDADRMASDARAALVTTEAAQ